jgi:C4-dicarboxylate-specific signal transduction histidine kinase
MSDVEVLQLKKDLKEAQLNLCEERHGNIDDRLKKIEEHQKTSNWWLIGIMGTTILQLVFYIASRLGG